MGYVPYQLVQDFFHQQYLTYFLTLSDVRGSALVSWTLWFLVKKNLPETNSNRTWRCVETQKERLVFQSALGTSSTGIRYPSQGNSRPKNSAFLSTMIPSWPATRQAISFGGSSRGIRGFWSWSLRFPWTKGIRYPSRCYFKKKLRNNTATERYMMERHVVDMVRFWAIQHRISATSCVKVMVLSGWKWRWFERFWENVVYIYLWKIISFSLFKFLFKKEGRVVFFASWVLHMKDIQLYKWYCNLQTVFFRV